MKNNLLIYIGIYLLSVLITSFAQILLKKSAMKPHACWIFDYLNPLVILAYVMAFGATFLVVLALKVVPLSISGIIEATGYVIVMILGVLMLKEKLTPRKMLGASLIILGAVIYSLQLGWYIY